MQWQNLLARLLWALRRRLTAEATPFSSLALVVLREWSGKTVLAVKELSGKTLVAVQEISGKIQVLVVDAAATFHPFIMANIANVDIGVQAKRFMRFFWDPEPRNDDTSAQSIWCLGREYQSRPVGITQSQGSLQQEETDKDTVMISSRHSEPATLPSQQETNSGVLVPSGSQTENGVAPSSSEEDRGWPSDFLDDFESRFWFTYRSQFQTIDKSSDPGSNASLSLGVRLRSQLVDKGGFTSDTGWGCMIRSGQCLLANALSILRLGRDWRRGTEIQAERQLVSLFADDPQAPFSLHRFVEHGASHCGKYPGEWFGPSATARCIQALTASHCPSELQVYVTGDGADVYEDTFLSLSTSASSSTFTPVLLLIGTRLGIDRVNPVYLPTLKSLLRLPQAVGIAGGRPSASHYFVGAQSNHLFYLDPHQTRPVLPYHAATDEYTEEEVSSCHTRRLRRLAVEDMDPSMLIAFLIKDKEDWERWKELVHNAGEEEGGKRIVHVAGKEPPCPPESGEREGAIGEVEAFDDEDGEAGAEDDDGEMVHV